MKSRSPLLVVCLALALACSGLTGWLHPAAAAQAGFDICSANGSRTADQGNSTDKAPSAHECAYCGSAPASGTAGHAAAAVFAAFDDNVSAQRPSPRAVLRARLNAEPRAPPALR